VDTPSENISQSQVSAMEEEKEEKSINDQFYCPKQQEVYGFGIGSYGRFGNGDEENLRTPTLITQLCNKDLVNISCGLQHAACNSGLYPFFR
jgi:alpha-tubulin suppressor-like RCC1 family protein